jgi:citrate synthase
MMSVLRTAVSAIGLFDARAESPVRETNIDMAMELTSQTASIVATFHRQRQGLEDVWSDPGLSHAANFLFMLTGTRPDPLSERVFDQCLTLHADHEFNASTFTGRVVASTLSDLYSAVSAAIGALRGPLHGGANTRVMYMLDEIGSPEKAAAYVKDRLARKERVMGFGHRVYKTEDPRAGVLRRLCGELATHTGQEQWSEICSAIEDVMQSEKGMYCNVDFYSAPVYRMLGLSTDLYTPIFAISRVVGWTAHILEQYSNNRLIRPLSNYTGPKERTVPPIEDRG